MTRTLPPILAAARAQALTVPCRDCGADTSEVCVGRDGHPLERLPAHQHRITDSGANTTLPPLGHPAPAGHPDKRRRHDNQRSRHELERRRHELTCDARAGTLTEAQRAELLQLDSVLNDLRDDHDPDNDYRRGPGGMQ